MTFNTIALELVPPDLDRGTLYAVEEACKIRKFGVEAGIDGRIGHLLIPGMIEEEEDRPVEMKPKLDVLDFWQALKPELPEVGGLCTQVTAFSDEATLRTRLTDFDAAGIEGVVFVGVPRGVPEGSGRGVPPTDALSIFSELVPNRGAIVIPTRRNEVDRFSLKCERGATFGLTQLLYSDAIVGFLTEFAKRSDHRPEILLSFGFVPKMEGSVGLINWLIQYPGNPAVAAEQEFVKMLSGTEPDRRRQLTVDLYKRVIDGVVDLGFPLSLHFEATYGVAPAAFTTLARMLDYWSPDR